MKDKFAELEEAKKRTLPAALAVFVIIASLFTYRISHTKPTEVSGVIESVPEAGIAKVRLDDGITVNATVTADANPTIGERVTVVETVGIFSAPTYQVTSKPPSQ